MKFTAKGSSKRHFELLDATDNNLGSLHYASWFSIKAEIKTATGDTSEVAPANIWQTSITIKKADQQLATLKFNWKGQLVLAFDNGPTYLYKRVGFFNSHFGVFNEHDQELVSVRQHFQFSSFSYNYEVETNDNYPEVNDPYFILLLIHGANYFHQKHAAV